MTAPAIAPPVRRAGLEPWLPWPLSAWRWWTVPVAAERLAALRIGLATLLVIDILCTYLPNLDAFFLDSGPSGSRVFGWYTQSPRWTWTVLHGLGDPFLATMILFIWLAATLGIVFDWLTRNRCRADLQSAYDGRIENPSYSSSWKLRLIWLLAGLAMIGSNWARLWDQPPSTPRFWLVPCILCGAAFVGTAIDFILLLCGKSNRTAVIFMAAALAIFAGLGVRGYCIDAPNEEIVGLTWLLRPWQNDPLLLRAAAGIWVGAAALLAIGWQTRAAAIVAWVLSTSFANLNPNIDNAGDVIRGIVLFYLMLCPCGAVWSLDRFFQRWRIGVNDRVVVSPWPMRLLFVQLVFIYFMNGLFKLGGNNWWEGDSLHYVLCDVTLTRFSYAQFPLPLWLTQLSTWTVLAWEIGFPLWVSLRWTRKIALVFGVLFHIGIGVSMELGNFAPYVLTMYLPLLPWERLTGAGNHQAPG
jgi:HTTM domain